MAPFVKGGKGSFYGVQAAIGGVIMVPSGILKNKGWKYWWVIPAAAAAGHIAAGMHNKGVAR